MSNTAEKLTNNVASVKTAMPKPQVKIQMYSLDESKVMTSKKGGHYWKQPASILLGDDSPPIPHSFYVSALDDKYDVGIYICDIEIRPGRFGAEFDLGKPRQIQEPK